MNRPLLQEGGARKLPLLPRPCTPIDGLSLLASWHHPAATAAGLAPHTSLLDPGHKPREGESPIAHRPQIAAFQQADQIIRPQRQQSQGICGGSLRAPGLRLVLLQLQGPKTVIFDSSMAPRHPQNVYPLQAVPT